MKSTSSIAALTITSAIVLSVGVAIVNASENPFAIKTLSNGYQVADHHEGKAKDGKCGEAKCGTEMKDKEPAKADAKTKDGKCGEGKCSAEMKDMTKTDAKAK